MGFANFQTAFTFNYFLNSRLCSQPSLLKTINEFGNCIGNNTIPMLYEVCRLQPRGDDECSPRRFL